MEEVPDPRLGLTLSSDLIQDPILCSSPFLRRVKEDSNFIENRPKIDLTRLFILKYRRIEQLWSETLFITSNNLSEQLMNSNNWWGERK
ncbi:hypothetical protein NC653_002508 [Populus alba x Populus x berolinensis]|uniref:Uncharacterized protein n=1 Tax=Populus alba x Populus x berolinensis TaxID=444605 RepID=A0AAD6WJ98_9ROSI|nr:hypothetical protein NC653_002508 [Populus alba x Populus x berolinensis]